MTAKRAMAAAAAAAAVTLLGGCELIEQTETWEPQKSDAVSVSAEGLVTEIIQETLDEEYYSADELKTMIDASVAEYVQTNGEGSVTVDSYETAGQNVTLTLTYASPSDFASFNNTVFFSGSLIEAQMEGYLFDTSFYAVSGGAVTGSALDSSEAIKNMAAQVLIVQGPVEVHLEGADVIMISTNAEMLSSDTVYASGKSSDDTELVLPSSAVYTGEKKTVAEQKKASRVYILYETE